jgi:enamidase
MASGTRNGARFLEREGRIGPIAAGQQADLMVVSGDPSRVIADARKVEMVFRRGVGFHSQKLVQSVSGRVGLW